MMGFISGGNEPGGHALYMMNALGKNMYDVSAPILGRLLFKDTI